MSLLDRILDLVPPSQGAVDRETQSRRLDGAWLEWKMTDLSEEQQRRFAQQIKSKQ